jgi:hypothetical protein
MASSTTPRKVRVAVTQAEPAWLDLAASVKKTCGLIDEAASNGAELVAFPECFIPGYPTYIWCVPAFLIWLWKTRGGMVIATKKAFKVESQIQLEFPSLTVPIE